MFQCLFSVDTSEFGTLRLNGIPGRFRKIPHSKTNSSGYNNSSRISVILSFQAFERIKNNTDFAIDGCHLELIKEERYEDMMKFIERFYVPDEPMGKSLNLQWDKDMENLVLANLRHNLSVVLVSSESGEIIAGQVVTIGSKYERFDKTKYHHDLGIAFDVPTNHLDSLCSIYCYYNVEEIVHLWQLAVQKDHRRKGIGMKVIKAVKEFVKNFDIGPVVLRVEGSSSYSQRIFEKLGFSMLAQVCYSDYKVEGKVIFANTGEHASLRLYGLVV